MEEERDQSCDGTEEGVRDYTEEDILIDVARFKYWLEQAFIHLGYMEDPSYDPIFLDVALSHLGALVLSKKYYSIRHDIRGPEDHVSWYPMFDENNHVMHNPSWSEDP